MKNIPTVGFTPIENPFTETCNLVFFYPLENGKAYRVQLTNDCGKTYTDALSFTAKGNGHFSWAYTPGGPIQRLVQD